LINSHIIPAYYLEQFARPSSRGPRNPGRVWVYEKGCEPQDRATRVQGRENGYFEFVHEDGKKEESFETVLAERENECNDILAQARSPLYHWPSGSEEKLAFYAALLFRRATQQRTLNEKNWRSIIDDIRQAASDPEYLRQTAADLRVKRNIPISEDGLRNSITAWIDEAIQPKSARNSFVADLLELAGHGARVLLKKRPWRTVRPPDGMEFVTSDNPVVSFVPLGNGLLHPGYGFGKEIADVAFPLAPDACLLMGTAWNVPTSLEKPAVDALNQAPIDICDRYVYSKTLSDEIRQRVDQYGGSSRYGVNAFRLLGVKVPLAREFLRTHFGLDD
jgi:hypothetical protein